MDAVSDRSVQLFSPALPVTESAKQAATLRAAAVRGAADTGGQGARRRGVWCESGSGLGAAARRTSGSQHDALCERSVNFSAPRCHDARRDAKSACSERFSVPGREPREQVVRCPYVCRARSLFSERG